MAEPLSGGAAVWAPAIAARCIAPKTLRRPEQWARES